MASMLKIIRTCGLIVFIVLQVCALVKTEADPWIVSFKVKEKTCDVFNCKYLLDVHGGEFLGHHSWRLTLQEASRSSGCSELAPNYELSEVKTEQWHSTIELIIPNAETKFFFCLRNAGVKSTVYGGKYVHQGSTLFLDPKNDVASLQRENLNSSPETTTMDLTHDIDVNNQAVTLSPFKQNDIEVYRDNKYVPLNEIGNYGHSESNNRNSDGKNGNDLPRSGNNLGNNGNNSPDDSKSGNTWHSEGNYHNNLSETGNKLADGENGNESHSEAKLPSNSNNEDNSVNSDLNNVVQEKLNNLGEMIEDDQENYNNDKNVFEVWNEKADFSRTKRNVVDPHSKSVLNKTDDLITKHDVEKALKEQGNAIKPISNQENHDDALIKVRKERNVKSDSNVRENQGHSDSKLKDSQMPSESEILKESPSELNTANEKEITSSHIEKESPLSDYKTPLKENEILSDSLTKLPSDFKFKDTSNIEGNQTDLVTKSEMPSVIRKGRQTSDFSSTKVVTNPIIIEGIRIEMSSKDPKIIEDGIPSVLAGSGVTLRIFAEGLTTRTVIAFTYNPQDFGEPCKFLLKGEYMVKPESLKSKTGLFEIEAPSPMLGSKLYICAKNLKLGVTDPLIDEEKYIHQGADSFKIFATHTKLLPLWVSLILILICLMFSALFSGLNLGLMSLDRTELKIISNTGTEQERKYARAIMPVRDHGNYLLCSILLGNVAVNSTFTILLDELTSGLFAVIFSTLAIVLLGEITPQAICSRHGLMVGAKSIMVTKAVMAITAPLAFPVSKLLDYFLGEEIGSVYNRERLKELVKVTTDVNDLDKDEVNIISGALELRKKKVSEVMTKLEDVFMLPITSVLDFETMSEIVKSGYSRIPVYESNRGNIVTVLFIKDLAFVDPDDNTPLRTLCQYYQNPCNFVFEDVTLDVMFKQFKEGHKGHMAFVHRINNEGEGDPFYETIGLVTLEDVIEEMIQAEIIDETDVFMDNRTKRRRNRPQNKLHQDFTAFAERHENQRIHISPQLTLATFQFLSSSVDAFRPDMVSETVLRRLLKQDVIQHIKLKGKTKKDPTTYVFHQGKPVDYFVLILEGRVEVTVGRENLVFEAGPFTYFGSQALTQNVGVAESPTPSAMGSLQNINMDSMLRHTFVPDYSVRAITELFYLTVKRSLYLAAKRATLMEKGAMSKGATNEQFDTEVDKHLCNSSSANIPISMISKKLLGKSTSTASSRDDLESCSTGYKLLQSVDEDISFSGDHKTPSRQVSPHPYGSNSVPRASLTSRASPELGRRSEEQEKLLKSP